MHRYHDEILRPIVVPFIHDHHLVLQHDNAQPHVAKICTQFLEAENIPVLVWPAYSPDMSPIEHVWDALDRRIRQRVPVPANIQQLHTTIEEEWTNIPQATINNQCAHHTPATGGEERVIEPIKWKGIIRRPWLTRASSGNLARTPGLHPYSLREVPWDF